MNIRIFACILLIFSSLHIFSQTQSVFKGQVLDQHNAPIQFANIFVDGLDMVYSTNRQGEFQFSYPSNIANLKMTISTVGKKTIIHNFIVKQLKAETTYHFKLLDLSLTLDEVNINPTLQNTTNSNSSIVYTEEAIEKIQAFSLMDILNTLPGKATTAPNINTKQTLTLRGNLGGTYDMNNSLGIPVIMDGIRLSNDANMQARSVSQWGMGGSILGGANNNSGADVPFQGMDLRDIPVETIEKIEVIQGVASAEYGELTDGAILINRKAGATPWQLTTNINGGSTNFSLSKGLRFSKKLGAINAGLNYAISNPDPRDKVKEYKRIATSFMWSNDFGKNIKNIFSFDFDKNLDEVKQDPDDDAEQMSRFKKSGYRVSNRFNWKLDLPWIKNFNLNASYSQTNQESYKQWLLNSSPKGYSYKDTTGIYEGMLIVGNYRAEEQIKGKPITASVNAKGNTFFEIQSIVQSISYGVNFNYSNNGGKGIIADPDRPRWVNVANQNARPYSFQYLKPIRNIGFFLTDNFTVPIQDKKLTNNFGLRADLQNGGWSLQPRLSSVLHWNNRLSLNAAFGVATKSPTMAHLHPAPTFIDIPLILAYNTNDALYLVYTDKYEADNSRLKPSKSLQAEIGARYFHPFFSTSINAYYKKNSDGFQSTKTFRPYHLPNYDYHYDEVAKKMVYNQNGTYTDYYNFGSYNLENLQGSVSYGMDWILSTKKIKAIQTSFNTSTSLIFGKENSKLLDMVTSARPIEIKGKNIWYFLYEPISNQLKTKIMSKLSSETHIPRLGFVVSTNLDVFWIENNKSQYNSTSQNPVAYFDDANNQTVYFTPEEAAQYARDISITNANQGLVYANLNISVAKEIKRKIRIGVTAYNAFNIRPEKKIVSPSSTESSTIRIYNNPISITGGISYKF